MKAASDTSSSYEQILSQALITIAPRASRLRATQNLRHFFLYDRKQATCSKRVGANNIELQ